MRADHRDANLPRGWWRDDELIRDLRGRDSDGPADDSRERPVLGVSLPLISVDAMTASAASKVALALDRLGLAF